VKYVKKGYNLNSAFPKGYHHSKATKLKISKARKKYMETHKGKNHPMYGVPCSEEVKQKIRNNHPDTSGKNNAMYGKHHSEESREKMREKHADMLKKHQKKIILGNAHYKWKGGKVKIICEICGNEFYVNHARIKAGTAKFCSHSCNAKSRAGEKHPNWQGGITPLRERIRKLPEYNQWRSDIFQRDNWTCVECEQVGKRLHAHHSKKSFSELLQEFLQEYNQFSPYEDKDTLVRLAMKWQPFWTAEGITLCKACHKLTYNYLLHKKK